MSRYSLSGMRRVLWPLLLTLTSFLFYVATLAPTVLWGDDAFFQRTAYTGQLLPDGSGHWLWLQVARTFVHIPIGDIAYRSNLLSAVAAAGTLFVLYLAAREAGLGREAATVALVSLAIGHTFWMHAVRAEVYTLFTLFVALHIWLWSRWRAGGTQSEKGRLQGPGPLYMGALLFGVTLLAHQMAIFLAPAWLVMVWGQRRTLRRTDLIKATAFALLGLLPFLAVIRVQISSVTGVSLIEGIDRYFTRAGADFGPALFDFSLATFPGDVIRWILFTVLQFCSPAILLAIWGMWDRLRAQATTSPFWPAVLAFYGANVVFSVSYRVNDGYAFLLPGYLALVLFAGAGWQAARAAFRRRRSRFGVESHKAFAVCLVALFAVPLAVYSLTPRILITLDVNPLNMRSLHGREPYQFFLWPGKNGYLGARQYGEETLKMLPESATLIADHTPLETLRYLQEVEGYRPDVRLLKIEPGDGLGPVLESLAPETAVYLADSNPDYYNLRSVPEATLAAHGPLFRLELPAH